MPLRNRKMTSKNLVAFFITGFLLSFSLNEQAHSQLLRLPGQLIFADDFERGQVPDRWLVGNQNAIKINYNPLNIHTGQGSMEVIALAGKEAGDMARFFLPQAYDKVHARWYCKFESDFDQASVGDKPLYLLRCDMKS